MPEVEVQLPAFVFGGVVYLAGKVFLHFAEVSDARRKICDRTETTPIPNIRALLDKESDGRSVFVEVKGKVVCDNALVEGDKSIALYKTAFVREYEIEKEGTRRDTGGLFSNGEIWIAEGLAIEELEQKLPDLPQYGYFRRFIRFITLAKTPEPVIVDPNGPRKLYLERASVEDKLKEGTFELSTLSEKEIPGEQGKSKFLSSLSPDAFNVRYYEEKHGLIVGHGVYALGNAKDSEDPEDPEDNEKRIVLCDEPDKGYGHSRPFFVSVQSEEQIVKRLRAQASFRRNWGRLLVFSGVVIAGADLWRMFGYPGSSSFSQRSTF